MTRMIGHTRVNNEKLKGLKMTINPDTALIGRYKQVF